MKTLDIGEATAPLADYAQSASGESVIVTLKGKPIAAVVPIENADWETVRLSSHPGFLQLIRQARGRQKAEGGISSAEMRRRLGL